MKTFSYWKRLLNDLEVEPFILSILNEFLGWVDNKLKEDEYEIQRLKNDISDLEDKVDDLSNQIRYMRD